MNCDDMQVMKAYLDLFSEEMLVEMAERRSSFYLNHQEYLAKIALIAKRSFYASQIPCEGSYAVVQLPQTYVMAKLGPNIPEIKCYSEQSVIDMLESIGIKTTGATHD